MNEDALPIASAQEVRSAIRRAVRPERKLLIASLVLFVIASAGAAVAIRILGMTIDDVSEHGGERLDVFGAILLGSLVIACASALAGRQVFARVAERSVARLRHEAFDSAMHLRLDTVERVGTADPLARLTGDVGNLSDTAHEVAPTAIAMLLSSALAWAGLVATSPLLAACAATGLPVIVLAVRRYSRQIRPLRLQWMATQTEVTRSIHEIAEGGNTIRAFRRERTWRERLDHRVETQWLWEWPMVSERSFLYPSANVAQGVSLVAVLIAGMLVYQAGWTSLGVISSAALYMVQAYMPIGWLFETIDRWQAAGAAVSRIVGIGNSGRDDLDDNRDLRRPVDGAVELRGVRFAYSTGHEVLHGVDLSVASGERIAVVGVSGAGKSTIAKLVAAIHAPTAGLVTVGGVPVSQLDERDGRRWVALVTQESHVFLGDIADNCRLARPDATDDDLERVLRSVGAWDWINQLPDALATRVGRDGHGLTLMQAQQLALARVLLIDPVVVILDEATAGLGSDMARGIERSFGAVLEGRTVITIAHRLDVAAAADRVVVVSHGQADSGTHDELLASNDAYANMWHHWSASRA